MSMAGPVWDAEALGRLMYEEAQVMYGEPMDWNQEPPWRRQDAATLASAIRDAVCPPGYVVVPKALLSSLDPIAVSLAESIRLRSDDDTVGVYFPVPQVRAFVDAYRAALAKETAE